ncbi:hypothetical protein KR51_00026710 [Rubidibacter lacunae KORDI 51-2]|uniref:Uncharacterized protein n=1 Tax=Rubidibacter lacunae KORDI 51-2 TaxID=582515 RepID=U5DGG6_9CHRO|nr:hypothetical protein KR51_00026710 [Rubidibacter lacunae KORDI 51-2]
MNGVVVDPSARFDAPKPLSLDVSPQADFPNLCWVTTLRIELDTLTAAVLALVALLATSVAVLAKLLGLAFGASHPAIMQCRTV